MLKSILILPRSGEPGQPAVRRACDLAATGTKLRVFDVVYESLIDGYMGNREIYEPLRSRVLRERQERADTLAKSLAQRGVEASGTAVWDHPIERAIASEIAREQADLVVTAPVDAKSGLSHGDWRLLSMCPAPVLLVKSTGERRYRHIVAAVDPFHAHAKPLELDSLILANAKKVQALTGATLTVLYCQTPVEYFGADLGPLEAAVHRVDAGAVERLAAAAGIPESAARVVSGAPHMVLQRMAERGDADLIIMGALARGRVKDFLIGSTAERLLHHARVDVMTVHPPVVSRATTT